MPTATRPASVTGYRCGRRCARVVASVAAEHGGAYGSGAADTGSGRSGGPAPTAPVSREAVPFGLPVLTELPALAGVLEDLAVADRAQLSAVAGLADLLRDGSVESTTGVGVDHWLAAVARLTRMDRRLLVRTCRLLHRLPTLDAAVRGRRVSFAQLRGLTLALRGVGRELDGQVDRLLGVLLDGLDRLDRPDPDVLVGQVADAVDELAVADLADRERDATGGRFLALQPRLDGTGGRVSGDLDAVGLALLDAATAPTAAQAAAVGGVGAARADLLLARLAAGGTGDRTHPATEPVEPADLDGDDGETAGTHTDADTGDDAGGWWQQLPPAKLLLRLRFETLLDAAVPAELLTGLVGGRLKLTGTAARRLVDQRGALLRTVLVDDTGAVVGVGRATRRPPGWLQDAMLAVHDTCTGPGCDRPAVGGQTDHAVPWWPVRPDDVPGTTDVDNLGPLCDVTNRAKEAAGWQVVQTAGGVRTWRHPRSGLTTTTVPATWRPAGDPRHDPTRHRRRPASTDLPGPHGPGPTAAGHDRPSGQPRAPVPPARPPEDRRDLPF